MAGCQRYGCDCRDGGASQKLSLCERKERAEWAVESFSRLPFFSYASHSFTPFRVMAKTITSNTDSNRSLHLPIYTQKYSLRRLSCFLSFSHSSLLHFARVEAAARPGFWPCYCCRDDDAVAEWDQSMREEGKSERQREERATVVADAGAASKAFSLTIRLPLLLVFAQTRRRRGRKISHSLAGDKQYQIFFLIVSHSKHRQRTFISALSLAHCDF